MIRPPPSCTLFPYTTLFRSHRGRRHDLPLGRDHPDGLRGHHNMTETTTTGAPEVRASEPNAHGYRSYSDRKSTRLNSSHLGISYAVFCLKKKKETHNDHTYD